MRVVNGRMLAKKIRHIDIDGGEHRFKIHLTITWQQATFSTPESKVADSY